MDNLDKFEILEAFLEALNETEYISSSRLAEGIPIGEKTLRSRIRELSLEIVSHGASIIRKMGKGYRLVIQEPALFQSWRKSLLKKESDTVPVSVRDRIQYELLLLFSSRDYIKRSTIGDFLFISEKTVTQDLKQAEFIMSQYALTIEKKAGCGLRAAGSEFSIRQCIMNHCLEQISSWKQEREGCSGSREDIGAVLLEISRHEKLRFSEVSLKCLIDYIYVSIHRSRHGFFIQEKLCLGIIDASVYQIAEKMGQCLYEKGIEMPQTKEEISCMAVYLKANSMLDRDFNGTTNLVINEHTDMLTQKILDSIYKTYHVDMHDNLNLRMYLNRHLLSLEIRLTYGIVIKNPLLQELKETYLFSWLLAQQTGIILTDYYQKTISEDEVAFFAMIFELEREHSSSMMKKVNILLVCATGKTSARFLLLTLRKRFERQINSIQLCGLYELQYLDLQRFDYIFSTVPIDRSVNITIIMIRDFMTHMELLDVEKQMKQQEYSIIRRFFKKELFFTGIHGNSREEIICELCNRAGAVIPLPDGFYQSVLYREQLGSTDFGNMVAIPHPFEQNLVHSLVCIGILDTPVLWEHNQVQLVILSAITNTADAEANLFFEMTSRLIMQKDFIGIICREQSFEALYSCLKQILETMM